MKHWKLGVFVAAISVNNCHDERATQSPGRQDDNRVPVAGRDASPRPVAPEASLDYAQRTSEDEELEPRVAVSPGEPVAISDAPESDPSGPSAETRSDARATSARSASATFISAETHHVSGTAAFRETEQGVEIHIQVAGAPPGKKGVHIHQTNDCSDIPNQSMGDHFAPETQQHGLPNAAQRHLGDLGNIRIATNGTGTLDITVPRANLRSPDALSFWGRAVVLHEGRDDGSPHESGNSGKPIACAPIVGAGGPVSR